MTGGRLKTGRQSAEKPAGIDPLCRPAVLLAAALACAGWFAACGARTESSGGSDETTRSALGAPACANHAIKVVDLHADFRDIWAGRETPQTGKQSDPTGQVAVDFSTSVQASLLTATFTPTDTSGKCGAVVPATPGASVIAGTVWGSLSSDVTRPLTPAPFNLFVRDSVSGVVNAAGPLAAGGDVSLSSFSLNGSAKEPIGLVTGGHAALTSGSIFGDLSYGAASTIPSTVTVSGKKSQQPFGVAAAFQDLQSLSTLLNSQAPTGTVTSSNGGLQLVGKVSGLNVFQLSADALTQATSISINVPAGAGALIGVSGASVNIVNKGITIQGATASTILWNLASARFLHVSSIGLPGSILAPQALLSFDSGSLNGTIVAQAFTSSGSGSLHYSPLKVSSLFGPSTPSSVAFKAAQPLVGGCLYQFQIPNSDSLTTAGACLAAPLTVSFLVAAHPSTAAGRELINFQPDAATHTLGRFTARAGINTPVDTALARYESAIGAATASLIAAPTGVPSATVPGQVITPYQQYAQGYPVLGYGYFVASANGIFRSANGRVAPTLPILPIVPSQTITAAAALQDALTFLKITQAPWVKTPSQYQAPVGTLVVVPKRTFPATTDFALAWSFGLAKANGLVDPAAIHVDAVTGVVIALDPGSKGISLLDDHAKYNQAQVDNVVESIYSGERHFSAAQYKNTDGSLTATLATNDTNADGALITATGTTVQETKTSANTISLSFGGFPQFVFDSTPTTPWTTTEPDEQNMASAQWALGLANTFLGTLALQVNSTPWTNVDGIGHQKVIVNYINPATMSNLAFTDNSDRDLANIYLGILPAHQPVEPDGVTHEFAHVLLDDLRRAQEMSDLSEIKESGALNEGVADLFAIAFNHKELPGDLAAPWYCLNLQGTGATLQCERNAASPSGSRSPLPSLYLNGGALGPYVDYRATDPTVCLEDGQDDCGIHNNSTIISHWGYLLAAGSSGLMGMPCDLQLQQLDPDPDTSLRLMLNLALLAAGTRTTLGGVGLPPEATFAQFRDATMQLAEELAGTQGYPSDTVAKVGLAWTAVGLAPVMTATSVAAPSNQSGVYPWATFVWPKDGSEGQQGDSWDFQIGSGDFGGGLLYENDGPGNGGITSTIVQNSQTLADLPLALPSSSLGTFTWRVRKHLSDPSWLACYPIHAFVGTTTPDAVNDLKVVSNVDPQTGLVVPGSFVLGWDLVHGTQSPDYDVTLGQTDPGCVAGTGVTEVPETGLSTDGTTESDQVDFILQPTTSYFADVQPIGPNDFTNTPSRGGCFALKITTTDLPRPTLDQPGFTPTFIYDQPWSGSIEWDTPGGAASSLVTFYDLDENGVCGTKALGPPVPVSLAPSSVAGILASGFPDSGILPNPTGYCWDVVDVAQNGDQSAGLEIKGQFAFVTSVASKTAPGVSVEQASSGRMPAPLPGDSYGHPVDFSWIATSQPGFPAAPAYKLKLGRWPWPEVLTSPDPAKCIGDSCLVGPTSDTAFSVTVRASGSVTVPGCNTGTGGTGATPDSGTVTVQGAGSITIPACNAGMGRYCWSVWPILDDPANPGSPWVRQPEVSIFPQFCYTTGPSEPHINVPAGPGYSADPKTPPTPFVNQPITGNVQIDYLPDGQLEALVGPGVKFGSLSNCQPDPNAKVYQDFYNCTVPFSIDTPEANAIYTIDVETFNSDQSPPVMDDTTLVLHKSTTITTGECGALGDACCQSNVCNNGLCQAGKCAESVVTIITPPVGVVVQDGSGLPFSWTDPNPPQNYEISVIVISTGGVITNDLAAIGDGSTVQSGAFFSAYQLLTEKVPFILKICPMLDNNTGKCDQRTINFPSKTPPPPPPPDCSKTLGSPVLPMTGAFSQGIDSCPSDEPPSDRVACIVAGGTSDICPFIHELVSPTVSWPQVPGATGYEVTQIGAFTFPPPTVTSQPHMTLDLTMAPLGGSGSCDLTSINPMQGYGLIVTAVDSVCNRRSAPALAAVGYAPLGP